MINGISENNKAFIESIDRRLDAYDKTAGTFTKQIETAEKLNGQIQQGYIRAENTYNSLKNGYEDIHNCLVTMAKNTSQSNYRADKLESSINDLIKKMSGITDEMKSAKSAEEIQPVTTASLSSNDLNDYFINTISWNEQKEWLKKSNLTANIIANAANCEYGHIYAEAYAIMRKWGINVDTLFTEYCKTHPGKSTINMMADSDYLRPITENAFVEVDKKYRPWKYVEENETTTKYLSKVMVQAPARVKELLMVIAKKNNYAYPLAAYKTYKEIERRTNINLKKAAKRYALDHGCSNCCTSYYISTDVELMDILKAISEGN